MQTKFAQSLTQRLSNDFETSLSIERAKVTLQGELELRSVVIRDHREDTLFFSQAITTKLDEFDRIFQRVFNFSNLNISQPLLRITTYAGEDRSSLSQFLDKLTPDESSAISVEGSSDLLQINDGRVEIIKENQGQRDTFYDLHLSLRKFSISKGLLTSAIDTITVRHQDIEAPIQLSGEVRLQDNKLQLSPFSIHGKGAHFAGTIDAVLPPKSTSEYLQNIHFDIELSDGQLPIELFQKPNQKPQASKVIALNGLISGTINQSEVELQLQFLSSSLTTHLLLKQDVSKQMRVKTKLFQANLYRKDAKELAVFFKNQAHLFDQMTWQSVGVQAQFEYLSKSSLGGTAQFTLPENNISTTFSLVKTGDDWELQQQFDVLSTKVDMFFPSGLEAINGNARLEATLSDSQVTQYQWEATLPSLRWNDTTFNNFHFQGKKDPNGQFFMADVRDINVQLAVEGKRQNDPSSKFTIQSTIETLNLSALGIAPEESQVNLSTDIQVNGKQSLASRIEVTNFRIDNRYIKNTFSDFIFDIQEDDQGKRLIQQGSDFFDLSVIGQFQFANVATIIRSSIQEAFQLPPINPVSIRESFAFDFSIEENILKALYPSISSPENISLEGVMSSVPGTANFSIDLPFLRYKNYTFESLSLVKSSDLSHPLTRFEAKRIYSDAIALDSLTLVSQVKEDSSSGSVAGFFGKSNNQFSADFSFITDQKMSTILLDSFLLNTKNNQWLKENESTPQLIYDHSTNTIQLKDFYFYTDEQSIAANIAYRTPNDLSVYLKTINLDLGDVLPESDKFTFDGKLNSSILFVRGSDMQADAKLIIDQLQINQSQMGDFNLTFSGSPQFNTYQIKTSLIDQSKRPFVGEGNVYIPTDNPPNIDVDFKMDEFDLSFLSRLGKENIKNVTGALSGELNLWGAINDLKLSGNGLLDNGYLYFPAINTGYAIEQNTAVQFLDNTINFVNAGLIEPSTKTLAQIKGGLSHLNFNAWEMDLTIATDRLLVYNRENTPNQLFYGKGFLTGNAHFLGPTKSLSLKVEGSTSEGSTLIIPWQDGKGLSDTSFIDFFVKDSQENKEVLADISQVDEDFRGFEMIFDLDLNRNAEVEIVVDQESGSTLTGRGAGNILIETNTDGKFNIWGDFIAYEGIYNFKNLGLIDKKFVVKQGGTIVWEGDPTGAQMNLEATYQVPGGANPALLVDNPNFNRKIPTNVEIQLAGNLLKPDDPIFDITFPNATGVVASEINYRLADQQRRQTQAISLLSQGIFISDVSVSLQGITNNLYEKASDVFSNILGNNEGKLNVGLNYLQGEENPTIDLRTEDRIGLTISTQISDKILFNGKIGVPIDGVDETVIVGDVQIDFILNENGNLRAKVFNRENEFRYLGDELGYTQGVGMSYQVDFNTFKDLIQKILTTNKNNTEGTSLSILEAIDYQNKSE